VDVPILKRSLRPQIVFWAIRSLRSSMVDYRLLMEEPPKVNPEITRCVHPRQDLNPPGYNLFFKWNDDLTHGEGLIKTRGTQLLGLYSHPIIPVQDDLVHDGEIFAFMK
jgi:hypothetical protein